jgi:hypothetical protein
MPVSRQNCFGVIFLVICLLSGADVWAGIDVSLERELAKLQELEQLIEAVESADTQEEVTRLRRRWHRLREAIIRTNRHLSGRPDLRGSPLVEGEIGSIKEQIQILERDLYRLRTEMLTYFPKARNRVAVFTFDDPDKTGLGDDLSFLISKGLLFSAPVRSFGVVNYQEGTAPEEPGALAYYDKVEKITSGQDFVVSIWGRITKSMGTITVHAFGQLGISDQSKRFSFQARLPKAMGGGTLHVQPQISRFPIARLRLSAVSVEDIAAAATSVRKLREAPDPMAPVVDYLREGSAYRVIASHGDWVQLQQGNGSPGWTSVKVFCKEECRGLTNIVEFGNGLVAAANGTVFRRPVKGLSAEARAAQQQIYATQLLASEPDRAVVSASELRNDPLFGPGFKNIMAVGQLVAAVRRTESRGFHYEEVDVGKTTVEMVARDLARTSLLDPDNRVVLKNLTTLFEYLKDEKRAKLATFLSRAKTAAVIGISEYQHHQLHRLRYAKLDARRVAQRLEKSGYDIHLLTDATRDHIRETLNRLREDSHDEGIKVLFLAGHVVTTKSGTYFMSADSDPLRPAKTGLLIRDLVSRIAVRQGEEIVVLADALISGTELKEIISGQRHRQESIAILAAGDGVPEKMDLGAGTFTYHLMDGLSGEADTNNDNLVTVDELYRFMAVRLSDTETQTPVVATANYGAGIILAPTVP